jgi:hypothetical protein
MQVHSSDTFFWIGLACGIATIMILLGWLLIAIDLV